MHGDLHRLEQELIGVASDLDNTKSQLRDACRGQREFVTVEQFAEVVDRVATLAAGLQRLTVSVERMAFSDMKEKP